MVLPVPISPHKKIISPGGTTVGLANGVLFADNKKIYSAENLKVGLFK